MPQAPGPVLLATGFEPPAWAPTCGRVAGGVSLNVVTSGRFRFGVVAYVAVSAAFIEQFAPVVELLAGH